MIARMWRGWVRSERIEEYAEIVERTGMAGYRQTPGNQGAQLLTRDLGDGRTELVTLSWWSDLDDIRAFAGDDIDNARYYPEDDEYLAEREPTVAHFDVRQPAETALLTTPAGESDGFLVTRTLNARVEDVFAHFVEPEPFSRWFVVPGYRTPADRIALDPRPGGRIAGVLVSEQTGEEIGFTAQYGSITPERLVQFVFADPPEVVTISLRPGVDGGTELRYRNEGASADGRELAVAGVDRMLDALAASVAR